MTQHFSRNTLKLISDSKILGIRAGDRPHRFTGIWVVVLRDRVFVRPWNDKPEGWYRVLLKERRGAIHVNGREFSVLPRKIRGERLMDAIDAAYGEKYPTRGSLKYVRGFAEPQRRMTTIELLPAS